MLPTGNLFRRQSTVLVCIRLVLSLVLELNSSGLVKQPTIHTYLTVNAAQAGDNAANRPTGCYDTRTKGAGSTFLANQYGLGSFDQNFAYTASAKENMMIVSDYFDWLRPRISIVSACAAGKRYVKQTRNSKKQERPQIRRFATVRLSK